MLANRYLEDSEKISDSYRLSKYLIGYLVDIYLVSSRYLLDSFGLLLAFTVRPAAARGMFPP